MPPGSTRHQPTPPEATPSENPAHAPVDPHAPDGGNRPDDAAKTDSKTAKAEDKSPGLYVIVAPTRAGGQSVELHSEESAESQVSMLTFGSKQHRQEAEKAGDEVPDGGGSHEINRRDIRVYKLNATEVTDF